MALSQFFSVNRRYVRSVNLERDFDVPDAVKGYILTEQALYALKRILIDPTDTATTSAKTLTSVYGTGKSAFAQFLCCLCAPESTFERSAALKIAAQYLTGNEYATLIANLIPQGFFRAISTAQREPLTYTIIRALNKGANAIWSGKGRKPDIAYKLSDLAKKVSEGQPIDHQNILEIVKAVLASVNLPVLLLIDELGKNLEFASLHQANEDLYLLQQLAELKPPQNTRFYLIGLLHQSFADYGDRLATVQRNEWSKIQGRFEDIAFTDTPRQMTKLIGEAIDSSNAKKYSKLIQKQSKVWYENLSPLISNLSTDLIATTYPLHPVTALVLPVLCTRYAQNERSLFTFLTSLEPFSFNNYLEETEAISNSLPLLKLDRLYDYFVEAIGMGLASRPQLHKWVEIHNLISTSRSLSQEEQSFLKTIGILNLVDSTGELRASPQLVKLAICDRPDDHTQQQSIEALIEYFYKTKGILNYRKQANELQLWEGTDFDIQGEITATLSKERSSLASILALVFPLKPVIAQRHSYRTGTVRYFERRYLDRSVDWSKLACSNSSYDGLIGYWVDEQSPKDMPGLTVDRKPLILLRAGNLSFLQEAASEFAVLKKIQQRPELEKDAVAKREMQYRIVRAERFLDETLTIAFDVSQHQCDCWIQGKQERIQHILDFKAKLSEVCDLVYSRSLILWNELVNRRELTSQGAKAARVAIEGMLAHGDCEHLKLQGNGPEVSIYISVLRETGIHRQEEGAWGFYPPDPEERGQGVFDIWQAIERFCLAATQHPVSIDRLYQELEAPPYGVKRGVIPVLLAAVLLYRSDDVSIYKDGTFIPVLGGEHFEILVKYPQRFAVKYFEVVGLRSQVFRELETVLRSPSTKKASEVKVRNVTMLSVVKPLFLFVKKLPTYTTKTKRVSKEAQAVVRALQQAQEPDELLFTSLPVACGLKPIVAGNADDGTTAKRFKTKLVQVLHEVQTAYDRLLADCQSLLHDAFGVRSNEAKLREDLRVRASYLTDACLERTLKRFAIAAADETAEDKEWTEALLMIVAEKPAESWTDDDVTSFEAKLSDIARRFINLEALQKDMATSKHAGFEARRITVTRPDGQEVHRMVWIEEEDRDRLDPLLEEILNRAIFQGNDRLQQALVAKLTERVLGTNIETAFTGRKLQEADRNGTSRGKKHRTSNS
jgi:hypothetical protein